MRSDHQGGEAGVAAGHTRVDVVRAVGHYVRKASLLKLTLNIGGALLLVEGWRCDLLKCRGQIDHLHRMLGEPVDIQPAVRLLN
ncbi:MAG: hypothetical protein BroJett007_14280 [Chloroflexota bacterium]|nr:MAG: hypothetical protein BroJett007_14280 [Chloroflexota bacterium]